MKPLGIIAGGGDLPVELAASAAATGREVFIAGIEGFASAKIEDWPHGYFHLGKLGAMFSLLKKAGCQDLVISGRAERPNISSLRLDGHAIRSLPRVLSMLVGGDDQVLTRIIAFIEEHGFRVVGAHDVAPELVMTSGMLGRSRLSKSEQGDLDIGFKALRQMGGLDMGQAAIIIEERIVAVEAAEGTDAMIDRVAGLRESGRVRVKKGVGVLVKAPKPTQDLRVDMPVIGPETVDRAAAAGLAGIGVAAGGVLIANREETARRIGKSMFLIGYPTDGPAGDLTDGDGP